MPQGTIGLTNSHLTVFCGLEECAAFDVMGIQYLDCPINLRLLSKAEEQVGLFTHFHRNL